MKRYFGITIALVLVIAVLAVAGVTYAQTQTPQPGQPGTGSGYGAGMMGGRGGGMMDRSAQGGQGMMGGGMMGHSAQSGQGMMGGGMRGGAGRMGGMMSQAEGENGIMHAGMVKAFAAGLGLSEADVEARLANGETMWQIAESRGQTSEQFTALMASVRAASLADLVKQGTLTQEQADWMQSHQGQMQGQGTMDCPMMDGDETDS